MLSKKNFIQKIIILSAFYMPLTQACEQNNGYEFENMLSISENVSTGKTDTESYNFKTTNCFFHNNHTNEQKVSSHIAHIKTPLNSHRMINGAENPVL